uniref:CreCAP-ShK5 n=1 Tax=Colubraria reticulata TaxID=604273 RepID=A0A481SQ44_9CAEN|nr:CreCAP-ShK5 [Colubraria reticulata]
MAKNVAAALLVLWVFAEVVSVQGGHRSVIDSTRGRVSSRSRRGVSKRSAPGSQDTCTAEFSSIPGHTMCMIDNSRVTNSGVSSEEREQIVQQHNNARRNVEPPATDLTVLVWNEKLAEVAEKWAKQCQFGHDNEKSVPGLKVRVGQNVAVGQDSWQKAIQGWHDEVKLYTFGTDPDSYLGVDGWMKIAHYTQMVQKSTHLVGCGFAFCKEDYYGKYYVCNYAAQQTDLDYPYTKGERCSVCPKTCHDGLCDCGGLICQNRGTLDMNTCTCKCPGLYKGVDCGELIPEAATCGGKVCENGGQLDVNTCNCNCQSPFTGDVCQNKAATCGGKVCENGGQLDVNTCNCNCQSPFTGDNCQNTLAACPGRVCEYEGQLGADPCSCVCKSEYAQDICQNTTCPQRDGDRCPAYSHKHCTQYASVPKLCPFKCQICRK